MSYSVIVEFAADAVRAGVYGGRRMEELAFYAEPMERTAGRPVFEAAAAPLHAVARAMAADGYGRPQRLYFALSPWEITLRIVTVPFEERRKILEVLPFELEGLLLHEPADYVFDAVALGDGRVMVAAVEKTVLAGCLDVLSAEGFDPCRVGTPLFFLDALLEGVEEETGAPVLLTPFGLAAYAGGRPLFYKPVRRMEDIELAMEWLRREGAAVDGFYAAAMDVAALSRAFAGAAFRELALAAAPSEEKLALYAMSRSIASGRPWPVDFRRGEFAYTRERLAAVRRLKVTAFLVLCLLGLGAGDVYLRYMTLSREYEVASRTLREAYRRVFPSDTRIVDELYQMESSLKTLRDEAAVLGGPRMLDVLAALARAGSSRGLDVRFTEVRASGPRVVVVGEAASFEGAGALKEALLREELFSDVLLTEVKGKTSGKTGFSLAVTLRRE
ncbi:MAG TPA: hypothetical protein ENJ37_05745 [Deltaproteobacteria bacterium]|nr:hypothetical protein [Deltaproteobacteria bacterium]